MLENNGVPLVDQTRNERLNDTKPRARAVSETVLAETVLAETVRPTTVRPAAVTVASVALALLGVAGLTATTMTTNVTPSLVRALPTLAASWQSPSATASSYSADQGRIARVAAVGHGPATRGQTKGLPTAGDEGFWLSRQDLTGSTADPVVIGDRITLGRGAGEPGGPATRIFEIIELRPLHDGTIDAASAAGRGHDGAVAGPVLTMVVGRQITADPGGQPRILRFLMEGTPAQVAPRRVRTPVPPVDVPAKAL
jgi:hypothetical protein